MTGPLAPVPASAVKAHVGLAGDRTAQVSRDQAAGREGAGIDGRSKPRVTRATEGSLRVAETGVNTSVAGIYKALGGGWAA